jgi:hypothetical protein
MIIRLINQNGNKQFKSDKTDEKKQNKWFAFAFRLLLLSTTPFYGN